jgi:uncharacterized membrane protein (DUF485 family)
MREFFDNLFNGKYNISVKLSLVALGLTVFLILVGDYISAFIALKVCASSLLFDMIYEPFIGWWGY